jgi:hypothetical protein
VLVEEGAGIILAGEVAALPAPIGPRAGQPVEHLAGIGLAGEAGLLGQFRERTLIGGRAPQPGRDLGFSRRFRRAGTPALRKVLLRQDVGCDLAPVLGDREVLQAEHDRAIRILDLGRGAAERDLLVR